VADESVLAERVRTT